LNTITQQTLVDVQILSRQLRPPLLDDQGLEAALRWLARDGGDRLGIRVRLRARGFGSGQQEERFSDEVETTLFRIAQESLTNAVRHGRAQHVWMIVRKRAAAIALTIVDDGSGFISGGTSHPGGTPHHGEQRLGLGLEGMRERTRLLEGRFIVRSAQGAGCVVRVVVPTRATQTVATRTTGGYSSAEAHPGARV
ncbi:MAG: sensor histidine kinase, partial [Ktedonobacterales bacterium]